VGEPRIGSLWSLASAQAVARRGHAVVPGAWRLARGAWSWDAGAASKQQAGLRLYIPRSSLQFPFSML
jgi:hypothetical protein